MPLVPVNNSNSRGLNGVTWDVSCESCYNCIRGSVKVFSYPLSSSSSIFSVSTSMQAAAVAGPPRRRWPVGRGPGLPSSSRATSAASTTRGESRSCTGPTRSTTGRPRRGQCRGTRPSRAPAMSGKRRKGNLHVYVRQRQLIDRAGILGGLK